MDPSGIALLLTAIGGLLTVVGGLVGNLIASKVSAKKAETEAYQSQINSLTAQIANAEERITRRAKENDDLRREYEQAIRDLRAEYERAIAEMRLRYESEIDAIKADQEKERDKFELELSEQRKLSNSEAAALRKEMGYLYRKIDELNKNVVATHDREMQLRSYLREQGIQIPDLRREKDLFTKPLSGAVAPEEPKP